MSLSERFTASHTDDALHNPTTWSDATARARALREQREISDLFSEPSDTDLTNTELATADATTTAPSSTEATELIVPTPPEPPAHSGLPALPLPPAPPVFESTLTDEDVALLTDADAAVANPLVDAFAESAASDIAGLYDDSTSLDDFVQFDASTSTDAFAQFDESTSLDAFAQFNDETPTIEAPFAEAALGGSAEDTAVEDTDFDAMTLPEPPSEELLEELLEAHTMPAPPAPAADLAGPIDELPPLPPLTPIAPEAPLAALPPLPPPPPPPSDEAAPSTLFNAPADTTVGPTDIPLPPPPPPPFNEASPALAEHILEEPAPASLFTSAPPALADSPEPWPPDETLPLDGTLPLDQTQPQAAEPTSLFQSAPAEPSWDTPIPTAAEPENAPRTSLFSSAPPEVVPIADDTPFPTTLEPSQAWAIAPADELAPPTGAPVVGDWLAPEPQPDLPPPPVPDAFGALPDPAGFPAQGLADPSSMPGPAAGTSLFGGPPVAPTAPLPTDQAALQSWPSSDEPAQLWLEPTAPEAASPVPAASPMGWPAEEPTRETVAPTGVEQPVSQTTVEDAFFDDPLEADEKPDKSKRESFFKRILSKKEEPQGPRFTCPSCDSPARVDIDNPTLGVRHLSCPRCAKMWTESNADDHETAPQH